MLEKLPAYWYRYVVRFARLRFLTSTATGQAIMDSVKLKSVAAPGPFGVNETKPAPSFALLPIIRGCVQSELANLYIKKGDTSRTVLAIFPS